MLNAIAGGVGGLVTGAMASVGEHAYFRSQDQLEAAQRSNNDPTFLEREQVMDRAWSAGQSPSLAKDCVHIAELGKAMAEASTQRKAAAYTESKRTDSDESSRTSAWVGER